MNDKYKGNPLIQKELKKYDGVHSNSPIYSENVDRCDDCVKFRSGNSFTCPTCGQRWRLAPEGPGQYWERIEVAVDRKMSAISILSEHLKEEELSDVISVL